MARIKCAGLALAITIAAAAAAISSCRNSLYENARRIDPFSFLDESRTTVPRGKILNVTIGRSRFALRPGFSRRLTATATYAGGMTEDVTEASRWESSDPLVAAVANSGSDKGTVTADNSAAHGSSAEIRVEFEYDGDVVADATRLTVVDGVCVSASGNDAHGDGSPDAPYRSIGAGITRAVLCVKPVLISGGEYAEAVVMAPLVSLNGGYADDFTERNCKTNVTAISAAGAQAVYVDFPVAGDTVIDGITIRGPLKRGDHSRTCGIRVVNGGGVTIRNSSVTGGDGDSGFADSMAVLLDNASLVRLAGCDLSGGSGNVSYGLLVDNNSQALMYNSVINGGNGKTSSIGIDVDNAILKPQIFRNNTIDGGNAPVAVGIFVNSGSSIAVENNIIFVSGAGSGTGIYENKNSNMIDSVANNDIFKCPVLLYNKKDGNFTAISSMEAYLAGRGSAASGNCGIDLTPFFFGAGDFRLLPGAPSTVKTGARDGSRMAPVWEFTVDKDGAARTGVPGIITGWTMGAYEQDE